MQCSTCFSLKSKTWGGIRKLESRWPRCKSRAGPGQWLAWGHAATWCRAERGATASSLLAWDSYIKSKIQKVYAVTCENTLLSRTSLAQCQDPGNRNGVRLVRVQVTATALPSESHRARRLRARGSHGALSTQLSRRKLHLYYSIRKEKKGMRKLLGVVTMLAIWTVVMASPV